MFKQTQEMLEQAQELFGYAEEMLTE